MDFDGTIAAVMDRLDFHERRLVALEARVLEMNIERAAFETQQKYHMRRIEILLNRLEATLKGPITP